MKIKNKFFLVFLVTCSNILFAQQVGEQFDLQVYFGVNQSILSKEAKSKLDSYFNSLTNSPDVYSFKLIGATDTTGNKNSNIKLAVERAYSVQQYFLNNGFSREKIKVPTYVELANSVTHSNSRTVTIFSSVTLPKIERIGTYTNRKKIVTINANQSSEFTSESGSVIKIPENAFQDTNGKLVEGEVQVSYQEFRNPLDFVLSGIPMSYNSEKGEHFSSAGMFELKVYHGEQELCLRPSKQIDIDFVTNDTIKDWNFYELDESQAKWETSDALVSKYDADDQSIDFSKNSSVKGLQQDYISDLNTNSLASFEFNSCAGDTCDAFFYLVENSEKYLAIEMDLSERLKLLQELCDLESSHAMIKNERFSKKEELQRINSYYISINDPSITISTNWGSSSRKIKFKVLGSSDGAFNHVEPFSNVIWKNIRNKQARVLYKMRSKVLYDLEISKLSKWDYTLVFYDHPKKIDRAKRYEIAVKPNKSDKSLHKMLERSILILERKEQKVSQLNQKVDSLTLIMEGQQEEITQLRKKLNFSEDVNCIKELADQSCFWELNKQFMEDEEKEFTIYGWYSTFSSNKDQFSNRYRLIDKNSENWKACTMLKRKKRQMIKRQKNTFKRLTKITIKRTGIYNCDKIKIIESPISVLATYKNKQGEKLDIHVVYLIDNRINGVIKYDGQNNYGPKKFVFNPSSKNRLILLDKNGKQYLANNHQFKLSKPSFYQETVPHTFIVRQIDPNDTKDDLF